jgi:hypothetical protein
MGDRSATVAANLFNHSGNFHPRNNSLKSPRKDGEGNDSWDRVFHLTWNYPPLKQPSPLKLNILAETELMVKATTAAEPIRTCLLDGSMSADIMDLAATNIALLEVISAVVEDAIAPMWPVAATPIKAECPQFSPLFLNAPQRACRWLEWECR